MGISERKKRERKERQKLILQKATELIIQKGVQGLSMQEIADAAEFSKATLYLYFKNKEDLLTELLVSSMDNYINYVDAILDELDDGLESLRKLWGSYLHLFGRSPDIFFVAGIRRYIEPKISNGKLSEIDGKLRTLIEKVLKRGVADGTLDPDIEPEKIARIIMTISLSIIHTIGTQPNGKRDVRKIQDILKSTFELLLRGVAADGTDRAALTLS